MAKDIKIAGTEYDGVPSVAVPLASGSGDAVFLETSDATAEAADILSGETAYIGGAKVTGTMVSRGAVTGTISSKAEEYTIPQGYHSGSGKVGIDSTEQAKIVAGNIKKDVTILGITGTYAGGNLQAKVVTPSASADVVVTADTGYDSLSQVTVSKISYVETTDPGHGGTIITIAGA